MDLKIKIDQFRLERRRRYKVQSMTTFEGVYIQQGEGNNFFLANIAVNKGIAISIVPADPNYLDRRDIIVYEDVLTYDIRRDSVALNTIGLRADPLIFFDSQEEKRRFVQALRNFLNYDNPEENPLQFDQEQEVQEEKTVIREGTLHSR